MNVPGTDVDLGRALLATLLAGLVAAGGLTAVDVLRPTFFGPGPSVSALAADALEEVPVRLLSQASFLLAVLFVVGPRTRPRDVLKGIAVLTVETVATFAPSLLSPSRTVDRLDPQGPLLALLDDAILVVAIAVAVWLAFRGGIETLRDRTPVPREAD